MKPVMKTFSAMIIVPLMEGYLDKKILYALEACLMGTSQDACIHTA